MHFDNIRPAGQWFGEYVVTAADYQRFDVQQFKAVNAASGGQWLPAKPIVIGGQGIQLLGSQSSIQCGAKTQFGGRLVLGASDFVQVFTSGLARSRTVTMPLFDAFGIMGAGSLLRDSGLIQIYSPPNPAGVVFLLPTAGGTTQALIPIPGRYLHQGGNIATMAVTFRALARPSTVPNTFPVFNFAGSTTSGTFQSTNPGGPSNPSPTWAPTTSFAAGTYVYPTYAGTNGFYFKATSVSGTHTSGASEPAWPTTIGNTVTDNPGANQIVWTCQGRSGQMWATTVDGYYNGGQSQTVYKDFDTGAGGDAIDVTTYRYVVIMSNPDPNLLLHSIQLTFSGISSMAFE